MTGLSYEVTVPLAHRQVSQIPSLSESYFYKEEGDLMEETAGIQHFEKSRNPRLTSFGLWG